MESIKKKKNEGVKRGVLDVIFFVHFLFYNRWGVGSGGRGCCGME